MVDIEDVRPLEACAGGVPPRSPVELHKPWLARATQKRSAKGTTKTLPMSIA